MTRLVLAAALVAASVLVAGCGDSLTCGRGSIEVDGECVSETQLPVPNTCGAGTVFNAVSGTCESELLEAGLGRCGPNTRRSVGADGVPVCEGVSGGCSDCSVEPPCPDPRAGNLISVCGRLYDLETSEPLNNDPASPGLISSVTAKLYDPIDFVNRGSGADVLATASLDSCGYYQVEIRWPFSGKIGIAVDDVDGSAQDTFVLTGVADEVAAGTKIDLDAFVLRATGDMAWAIMAGNPQGTTSFADHGVYVPIYVDTNKSPVGPFKGAPTGGVAIRGGTGQAFYFADTDPLRRTEIAPAQLVSGANGTGVLFEDSPGSLSDRSGDGPAGCTWPTNLGGSVAGALFVQLRVGACTP